MFENLFKDPKTIDQYRAAPLVECRLRYLRHRAGTGIRPGTVRSIAVHQLRLVHLLDLGEVRRVSVAEIVAAAEAWSCPGLYRYQRPGSSVSKADFVANAVRWLHFMGCLEEREDARHAHTAEVAAYERWMRQERGLSDETIRAAISRVHLFFDWLAENDLALASLRITDIDRAIAEKNARRNYSRITIKHFASEIRAFIRYAEERGLCRPGMAPAIIPPRIYPTESVPAGLNWADVKRLLASTEGSRPADKRDRAILMMLIAYGLRSGEVRGLRLDDIDWENETLRVRRSKLGRTHVYPLSRGVGQARIRELESRCGRAQAAEKRQRGAQQGAAAILVTDEAIEAIRSAAKGLETVESRLSAAATRIVFDMTPAVLSGIEIDGQALSAEQPSVQAVEPVTIAIPDHGRITIEPAIKDRDKLLGQQRDMKATLKDALQAGGTKTVNDAEDQYAQRHKLRQKAELARQEVELHAPATDDHDAGAQGLSDYVEGFRKILTREMADLDVENLPEHAEAEAVLRAAVGHAEKARRAVATARAALAGPETSSSQFQTELGTVKARYDDGKERLEKLRRKLADAEQELSDDQLQARTDAAQGKLSEQETAVAVLEARRTDETIPQLEARIARLDRAIQDRRDKRGDLKVKIAGLRSRVEVLEGAGLDEAIQQKARELDFCEEERRRIAREVQVLSLLLSTLRAAEQDAKERYLSPVLNRVRPYLQLLFPGAEITIDENLHIVGVVREAGYEEAFHHLSMGTQEQIAVLIRLAFAEMLVEQGHPATVILDDALVFSDDRRMSRMFDILNMAAQNVQVIIFTCREQLFEELGGRQLSLLPGSSEELVSA